MAPKVLLVEDEEENQLLGTTLLKQLGVEATVAKNGAEALSLAHEKQPDLILLDVMMPVMGGLKALEMLQADEKTKGIPVVMLTSQREFETFQKAQKLGAKGYLTKPYDIDEFKARVCVWLGIPLPTSK